MSKPSGDMGGVVVSGAVLAVGTRSTSIKQVCSVYILNITHCLHHNYIPQARVFFPFPQGDAHPSHKFRECSESPCPTSHLADQDAEDKSLAKGHTEITDGVFGWNPKRDGGKSTGFGGSLMFKPQFFYM